MTRLTLGLLWFSAVVFAAIGIFFLGWTEQAADSIDVAMRTDTARVDISATYGGMCLGLGALFAWATRSEARHEAGLWSMLLVYGGLALGRLVPIVMGQRPEALMWIFLGIEVAVAGLAAWLLRSEPGRESRR